MAYQQNQNQQQYGGQQQYGQQQYGGQQQQNPQFGGQQQQDYGGNFGGQQQQNPQYGSQQQLQQQQQPDYGANFGGQQQQNQPFGGQQQQQQQQQDNNNNDNDNDNDNDKNKNNNLQQAQNYGVGGYVPKTSKYWDENAQNQFSQEMKQKMMQILGYNEFDQNVSQLTNAITAASQEALQAMKKPNFKYVSHALLVPVNGGYNMGQNTYWQPKTDVIITVRVDTQTITAILEAYCIGM